MTVSIWLPSKVRYFSLAILWTVLSTIRRNVSLISAMLALASASSSAFTLKIFPAWLTAKSSNIFWGILILMSASVFFNISPNWFKSSFFMSLNMIFPPTSIFPDGSVKRNVLMSSTGLWVNNPEASPLTAVIKSLRICSSVIFLAEICANLRFNTVKAEASRCSAAIWISSGPYFSSP